MSWIHLIYSCVSWPIHPQTRQLPRSTTPACLVRWWAGPGRDDQSSPSFSLPSFQPSCKDGRCHVTSPAYAASFRIKSLSVMLFDFHINQSLKLSFPNPSLSLSSDFSVQLCLSLSQEHFKSTFCLLTVLCFGSILKCFLSFKNFFLSQAFSRDLFFSGQHTLSLHFFEKFSLCCTGTRLNTRINLQPLTMSKV